LTPSLLDFDTLPSRISSAKGLKTTIRKMTGGGARNAQSAPDSYRTAVPARTLVEDAPVALQNDAFRAVVDLEHCHTQPDIRQDLRTSQSSGQ
jgi:hypothetical protein